MKILYAARMCRYDLLFAVCSLARCITKWTRACDRKMLRLVSYIHHNKNYALHSIIGDPIENCRLLLFADADFAVDKTDSKSTSGGYLVLAGPNTFAPLGAICKSQSAQAHSSTEAEIISLEYGLRTEGLPALIFWDFLLPILRSKGDPLYHPLQFLRRGDLYAPSLTTRVKRRTPTRTRRSSETQQLNAYNNIKTN